MTKTSSANLNALHAEHKAGGIVTNDAVSSALAQDILDQWNAERNRARAEAAAAERKTWTNDLADFIATTLAADEGNLFPRFTTFTTDRKSVVKGNGTVVIEPLSRVEHDGRGKTSGNVSLSFHDVAAPDVNRLREVLDPHSISRVEVGNWPTHTVQSDGWVLAQPRIAQPSATSVAVDIQRYLTDQHLSVTGTWIDFNADVTIGESQTVQISSDTAVLRGHVRVTAARRQAPFDNGAVIDAATSVLRDINNARAFIYGVGKVQSAALVDTTSLTTDDHRPALGIAFELTATGRYDG